MRGSRPRECLQHSIIWARTSQNWKKPPPRRDAYLQALDAIAARKLPASISLKLTALGLDLSEQACVENLLALAKKAQDTGTRVEVDMEGSHYTETTIRVVERVALEFPVMRAGDSGVSASHSQETLSDITGAEFRSGLPRAPIANHRRLRFRRRATWIAATRP